MYALVADIERYPEFLPMCTGLTILTRKTGCDGEDLTARMSVGYKSIAEHFTSHVILKPAVPSVAASYLDGPFKRLDNRWRFFDEAGGGSRVDFSITYELKSIFLQLTVGALFDQAFRKFAEAFEDRARKVYGAVPGALGQVI